MDQAIKDDIDTQEAKLLQETDRQLQTRVVVEADTSRSRWVTWILRTLMIFALVMAIVVCVSMSIHDGVLMTLGTCGVSVPSSQDSFSATSVTSSTGCSDYVWDNSVIGASDACIEAKIPLLMSGPTSQSILCIPLLVGSVKPEFDCHQPSAWNKWTALYSSSAGECVGEPCRAWSNGESLQPGFDSNQPSTAGHWTICCAPSTQMGTSVELSCGAPESIAESAQSMFCAIPSNINDSTNTLLGLGDADSLGVGGSIQDVIGASLALPGDVCGGSAGDMAGLGVKLAETVAIGTANGVAGMAGVIYDLVRDAVQGILDVTPLGHLVGAF